MPPPQSPKATPPRAGTSRLLAMKFMNRLGPSDSTPTTSSPLVSAPSTPVFNKTDTASSDEDNDDDNRPSAKRRKVSLSGDATASSPATAVATAAGATVAEMEATMRASMDEEERRRQVAIKRRAAELGDEHWTWNAPLPTHVAAKLAASSNSVKSKLPYAVVRVGYAEIDDRADSEATGSSSPTTPSTARLVAGSAKPNIMRFNMKKAPGKGDESDDEDDESTQGGDKKSRKRSRSDVDSSYKKKETTKLKHLTSLSSQGGQSSAMKCHKCGRPGHKAASCPAAQSKSARKKR
ncbi:uncharacterized protein SPSK_07799 [Sporothrix schenckii 1099-18]|uniref:CCHC-type domain-containing protein n=2 Tax=Sporothrix schenckii TaxID=29908 RepID=U7Q494_SPOS1|nr:uncharacterized protein SPSK_07799 [Sporothrix schenckii 1099-18]ERT01516.1 hypothetical protein HMPREF1624_02767 [Sporothrix schenckii ATCC 58251]KJR88720.1 hypothetical protein SPSK_07799 [Sporothrix schenckii 1099-18]